VERFCELGVKVEFGVARFTDEYTVSYNRKRVTARNWVIATGSSPAIPDVEGLDRTPFITNKELFYLDELPRSLIVIGGGAVAVEMAQAMCRLGSRVDVIQRSGQILSKEDRDIADEVMTALKREGVTFHLNTMLTEVRDCGQTCQVAFENGDGHPVTLEADSILVALGRAANVTGLGLEDAGVHCSWRGIEVDGRLRTSQKHIYAAGDVTGLHQYTHAAGYEAGVVLTNAVLRLPRKADYTWLPHAIYCDPEFASIGLNERAAEKAGIEYTVWKEAFRDNDRSLAEGYDVGVLKMIVDKRENVLGVQILGPHAGELINEWVAVLNGRVRLSTLAGAVHPYPTLGEINKRIAGDLFAGKLFSDSVRKKLKFFFNLKGRACGPEMTFPAA